MKKKRIAIICVAFILIIAAGISLIFVFGKDKEKKTYDKDQTIIKEVKTLLEKDNELKNLIYGNPKLNDSYVEGAGKTYKGFESDTFKTLDGIKTFINDNYKEDTAKTLLEDINKYNIIVEADNSLFVEINAKCTLEEISKNLSLTKRTTKTVTINYKNINYDISINSGKYKLGKTPFECK